MSCRSSATRAVRPPSAPRPSRYVIHFIGDIHQPLHDSDNNDEGGNCTALHFFAEVPPAKLHAMWDYKLIQRDLTSRHLTQAQYAKSLDRGFTSRTLNPVDWAWEGHQLALAVVYGDLEPQFHLKLHRPRLQGGDR